MLQNSLKSFLLATRPKTLTATLTPVLVAAALAYRDGHFKCLPAAICLIFALLAQIISNFANDYFDFKKGADNAERLGPKRAIAEGWVSPKAMLWAIFALLALDMVVGLSLLCFVRTENILPLFVVGAAVAMFALLYSGGPYPLAYHGWGDVCVFVFFGIVPVGFTYFVQAERWNLSVWLCAAAVGLTVINILVSNNYRDYYSDKNVGKRTSIVIFGKKFGECFYLFNGIIAVILCQYFWFEKTTFAAILPSFYLIFHIFTYKEMKKIDSGKGLIITLEKTARNTLIFGVLLAVGLILG